MIKNVCNCKNVYVSAVYGTPAAEWLPARIIKNKLDVTYMVQLHKLTGVK